MSFYEKLVRKSGKADNVWLISKIFSILALIFLVLLIIGSAIFLKESETINLADTNHIIIITVNVITFFEFFIFLIISAILGYYCLFLDAIHRRKLDILEKKSIKPILKDTIFTISTVGIILILLDVCLAISLLIILDIDDELVLIISIILTLLEIPLAAILGSRISDYF